MEDIQYITGSALTFNPQDTGYLYTVATADEGEYGSYYSARPLIPHRTATGM